MIPMVIDDLVHYDILVIHPLQNSVVKLFVNLQ